MLRWLMVLVLGAVGQAGASTGVSCLLKTQVVSVYDQPFSQQVGQLRVLVVRDDLQNRNDFPCSLNFRRGQRLLVELGFYDLKVSMRYGAGQVVYLNFVYTDDRSGLVTRTYQVVTPQRYYTSLRKP